MRLACGEAAEPSGPKGVPDPHFLPHTRCWPFPPSSPRRSAPSGARTRHRCLPVCLTATRSFRLASSPSKPGMQDAFCRLPQAGHQQPGGYNAPPSRRKLGPLPHPVQSPEGLFRELERKAGEGPIVLRFCVCLPRGVGRAARAEQLRAMQPRGSSGPASRFSQRLLPIGSVPNCGPGSGSAFPGHLIPLPSAAYSRGTNGIPFYNGSNGGSESEVPGAGTAGQPGLELPAPRKGVLSAPRGDPLSAPPGTRAHASSGNKLPGGEGGAALLLGRRGTPRAPRGRQGGRIIPGDPSQGTSERFALPGTGKHGHVCVFADKCLQARRGQTPPRRPPARAPCRRGHGLAPAALI